ncbi:metallophosphoesterase family protein [Terrisporobacter sp.]|uniref:metallophosphoesterase family protein n=1 Tax=Terrisporobacter sp. TaxID=1965305 RepID=UPI0028995B3F|nr:metallophosphoesterase family protein [Terrisporobacter sp.]
MGNITYIPPRNNKAKNIKIDDVDNNFQSNDVEGVLKELAENGGSGSGHMHVNKSVLDTITQEKIDSWDDVTNKADKTEVLLRSKLNDNGTGTDELWSANKLNTKFDTIEQKKANETDLLLQKTRIDNLATLSEGSTTGDAELIDARIGADGKKYNNVGESVRNQIKLITNNDSDEMLTPYYFNWTNFNKWFTTVNNYRYLNEDTLTNVYNTNEHGYSASGIRYIFYKNNFKSGKLVINIDSTKIDKIKFCFFLYKEHTKILEKTVWGEAHKEYVSGEFNAYADYMHDKENFKYRDGILTIKDNLSLAIPKGYNTICYIDLETAIGNSIDTTTVDTIRNSASKAIYDGAITVKSVSDKFDNNISSKLSFGGKNEKPIDSFLSFGIHTEIADLLWNTKEQWMTAWGGNRNKIPFIVATDVHGNWYNGKPVFDYLAHIVPWDNVSKFLNLGDCIFNNTNYQDDGSEYQEKNMVDALEKIPKEKLINVMGNHDVMKLSSPTWLTDKEKNMTNLYFRNYGAKYYDDVVGDFVIYDDYYNIKYVCVSGWSFKDIRKYANTSEQLDSIIKELEINDGYDIVLISHVPLAIEKLKTNVIRTTEQTYDFDSYNWGVWEKNENLAIELWNGVYKKQKGTVLDSDGNSHAFDFTNLKNKVLCGIHGHTHQNGWYHVGNNGLLDILCKNMYIDINSDSYLNCVNNYISATSNSNSYTITFGLINKNDENVEIWNVSGASKGKGEIYGLNHWVAPFTFTPSTSLVLSNNNITGIIGAEIDINATIDSQDESIVWRSTNESVARVWADYLDGNIGTSAKIYCVGAGSAIIQAVNESGTVTSSCEIIVS